MPRRAAVTGGLAVLFLVALLLPALRGDGPAAGSEPPPPLDPQVVRDQDEMTWGDYRPVPGHDWADPSRPAGRRLKVALVAVDFPDQPFVITLPKGSDPFGNPQIDPVARDDVPRFYADFFNTPGELNRGQTINGFWMEVSRGKVGIAPLDAYGPYRMPRNLFEYGLNEWGQAGACPAGFTCDGRLEADADALWLADAGRAVGERYDVVLRIYAGYDETSVWQEFGEMKFATKADIPAQWGNPDASKPRWVATRYVPWTSWRAGQMQWGLATVRQGESSGTITHEIAHFIFDTGDNNNNPYVTPYRRAGSGPWDLMDRGSFNGPGGPHRRWVVPPREGASMPAGLTLRNRLRFGFVPREAVVELSRTGLAASGPIIARVVSRAADPGATGFAGIAVRLDGDPPHDRTPPCEASDDPLCPGEAAFDFYAVEVVQRIGYDSFTPDEGVLISKNKDDEGRSCGYNCFTWVVDARPEDAGMLDFVRPDGTKVMRTIADYRQLNDALFHAGLRSGSAYEWQDGPNRLHFYVVDVHRDERGLLSYTVGVRSLDGHGPHRRGVALDGSSRPGRPGTTPWEVTLRNTGAAAPLPAGAHPQDHSAGAAYDIYRLAVAVEGRGWSAWLRNGLAAVPFGSSQAVPVQVAHTPDAEPSATITLTATSESEPSNSATLTTAVRR